MIRNEWRHFGVLTILAGTFVLFAGTKPAQAIGFGAGIIGGFNYVPSPTDFLNSHALIIAGRGQQAPSSFRPYANNPNSFHNRVRDNGFVPSYDVRRRQPSASRRQPARSLGNTARAAPQPTSPAPAPTPAPRTVPPLLSFFDAALRLVWPGESPVAGDLREKRDLSDEASLVVLEETKRKPVASLAAVAEARQKLLDYGRPALQEIRIESTERIADAFHEFILSLYESLAQAATSP